MKKLLLSVISCLLLHSAFAQLKDMTEKIAQQEKRRSGNREFQAHTELKDNYDILYHRMNWYINPQYRAISGSIMTVFRPKKDMSTIEFDLTHELTVDSVLTHRGKANFTLQANDILHIELGIIISPAWTDSVTVFYHGVPPSSGFGSFSSDKHADIPVVWTLSEPFGARDWWPCKQDLGEKIDSVDIYISCPLRYRGASNGTRISEDSTAETRTTHWKHTYPIATYLVGVCVTNYDVFTQELVIRGDSMPVVNYVYPEDLDNAKLVTPVSLEAIKLYDSLFVPYPFWKEKYGQAQFGWGGGMEHQTMSFVTVFEHELLVHELAHQWFGDKVTCGNWRDIWLNEAFATYLSGLTYEHMFNAIYWPGWKQGTIDKIVRQPDGSVYVDDSTSVDRIFSSRLTYYKGAYLLHMLRWVCGEKEFFQGVRNYLNDPVLAYRFAFTDDLKRHLEGISGKDLTEFFADWFYGQGYPSYTLDWLQNESNELTFSLRQQCSHESVSFFEMPVPVRIIGPGYVIDTVLDHRYSGQLYKFAWNRIVDEVQIDPELHICSAYNKVFNITHTLQADPMVFLVSPSMVSDRLDIDIVSTYNTEADARIFDMKGVLVKEMHIPVGFGSNQGSLDCRDLGSGYYIVKITAAEENYTYRFLKK